MSKYLKNMNVLVIIGTILIVMFCVSLAHASDALGKPPQVIKPPQHIVNPIPMKITRTADEMEKPHAIYHKLHGFKEECSESIWYDDNGQKHLDCVWLDKDNRVNRVKIY